MRGSPCPIIQWGDDAITCDFDGSGPLVNRFVEVQVQGDDKRLWWDLTDGLEIEWNHVDTQVSWYGVPRAAFYTCSDNTWLCNPSGDRITVWGATFGYDASAVAATFTVRDMNPGFITLLSRLLNSRVKGTGAGLR